MKANKTIIGICCAVLAIVWGILAAKTFNPKPDLNGDNFNYYIYASSLATGHGYSDLSTPDMRPTAAFIMSDLLRVPTVQMFIQSRVTTATKFQT